ncbi:MAG TPA: phosphoribosylanthranilate isomerase [Kiritimatiellae bacterium]|nr:phosphoribosylanthranilate isomerase [Kiritimatiellia bacterium]
MGIFVKICGLASAADVERVAELSPDAMGFVFWSRSPRAVRVSDVAEWVRGLPRSIVRVGVFVDASRRDIERVMHAAGLDVVQLHGNEPPGLCRSLPFGVWKAVHLKKEEHGFPWREYRVDAFLVDSYSAGMPGGTGVRSDWDGARRFIREVSPLPVILAGGLNPQNVASAITEVRPWGVDVSSGVESGPGRKDIRKVEDFLRICRAL